MASVDLQEKANFTRLSRLLVDKGTEALRNAFDAIHPPANLPAVLDANRKSLLRLKFRVISNSQWDLLFPPSGNPPDSKTFDVTSFTVLFRNICGLPSTGWGAMPADTNRSMQANILRIKLLRNEIYAHVASTQVDNATFESLWQKISKALVELNIPQNDIDGLKTNPLGPEEEMYVETLKEWKSQEDDSIKMLEGLSDDVKSMECSVSRLAQITENKCDELKQLCKSALEQQSNIESPQSLINHPSQVSKDTDHQKNWSKESDEDLLRKLAKHNFKGKIRSKVNFFHPGTREWLLQQVDEFVEKEEKSTMLLLTAGPGFGKSVFAAKVCEDFKKKGKLAASHFCDFSNSNLRDPMMMLQSLASQMCENIAAFKEKLLDQLRRPHQVRSLKDAFRIYLQNPLDELDLEEPSLVVIDGLDESAADDKNEIVNLIADYFPDLPQCIKVLVTSRPELSIANLSSVQKINIANNDTLNNLDLKHYLKACLPSLADRNVQIPAKNEYDRLIATHGVFEVLVWKCEGSFLYAFYVQSELQKRGDLDKITCEEMIKFLPVGINSIYQAYFKRLEDELKAIVHANVDVLIILKMLVTSEGSLPLSFVTRAFGLAPDNRETRKIIDKVNETVSCLLYVFDDLVTVFHKSVIDWLLAEGYKDHEYTVKVSDGNKSLWVICEQVFEEIKKNVCSGDDLSLTNDVKYALYYGPHYLVACKMKESYFWLVDVVIIHALLTVDSKSERDYIYVRSIFNIWVEILQGAVVIDDKLRARMSWHVTEIDYDWTIRPYVILSRKISPFYYLQNVLVHSPEGYFCVNEKKFAESLLSKVPRFVEFNFDEVEVMPRGVWRFPKISDEAPKIRAVGLSYDKTMAAVAQRNGTIIVISVPRLVELWQYSTEYKSISCCTFAPDSSFVLFGKLETVLSIAEAKEVPFFHGNKETFKSCAFSPHGKRLVTSDGSSTVKLWDVANQRLLSSLCANVPVNWCSFSSVGLFIIGKWLDDLHEDSTIEDSESDSEYDDEDCEFQAQDAFCVWNAITWHRSDERNLPDVEPDEGKAIHSKLCHRCFRPGFKELNTCKKLEIELYIPPGYWELPWLAGVYNGVECIFALDWQLLRVIENTHFSTLAAWQNIFFSVSSHHLYCSFNKITAIEDDLWFYADVEKLIVFSTSAPIHQQSSRLPLPTRVLLSSFSPDGSRLATCTSDGYINIWNVHTNQVEQRFKSNHGDSSFACWWSEKFLFVFDFFDRIPSLSKYPVDVNLNILFPQSQQVSLSHLLEEFVSLSVNVDFSEGLLSFECGKTKPVKVLDVSGVGGPRMITLPGIKPRMSITVSPGASFVFGDDKYMYYIWKRNAKEEPDVYEVFFTKPPETPEHDFDERSLYLSYLELEHDFVCFFNNDCKVAVVSESNDFKIFDLDTGDQKTVNFDDRDCYLGWKKIFCLNKDRVVIAASYDFLEFFDMDSSVHLGSSFQRYLTRNSLEQLKLSPEETMMAFPKINGNMEFLRLCIPQSSVLSSIKCEAANKLEEKTRRYFYGF